MDDLLADALDDIEVEADGHAAPPCPGVERCWEQMTVCVLADLGLSKEQIAHYLRVFG